MKITNQLCLFTIILLTQACSPVYNRYIPNYKLENVQEAPDYANPYFWAALPSKKDPSDSIPAPLKDSYRYDSSIDVFFLHPTTYTDKNALPWNASIDDAALNAKTDYSTILFQASTFNEYRLFAPRYRQAHIRSYFTRDTTQALEAFELAYQDIKKAFQYYLDHENKGHPIIIASHSQGTTHALRLLKEFFDGTPLQKKLVSAYLVGMYIPNNQFKYLSICSSPNQTQCVCGWRTFRINHMPPFVEKEKSSSWVTNPISWTTDSIPVTRSHNPPSILKNFNKAIHHVAGAQIHNGIIWTHKPKFPGSFLFRTKNYHIGDINLYYYSIRENLRQRVANYTINN